MMRDQIKKLLLGNGLAQLLQFCSVLVLSRIYQPWDFGFLAEVQSIAMIASILLTLQLHLVIPLSKTHEAAQNTVRNVQWIVIIISLITLLPAVVMGGAFIYALVLSVFLGLINSYTSYLVYCGNFGRMSVFYVTRAVVIIAVQIIFASVQLRNGLVVATLIGEALSAFYLGTKTIGIAKRDLPRLATLITLVKDNKSFSVYGTIQEIISVSAFYAPLLLFTVKYGKEVGGQYAMANRLVWAPVVLVSRNYAQVLYHKLGRSKPTTTADLLDLTPDRKLSIALIGLVVATFFMTDFFNILLGREWELASDFLPAQMIWGLFFLASTPFRVVIRVLLMQRIQLFIDLVMIILTCIAFYSIPIKPLGLMTLMLVIVFTQHASTVLLVYFRIRNS